MMLLALDTSSRFLGIALYDGVSISNETLWVTQNHHSVELAPAVSQGLARAGLTALDIRAIGVALGPGSFTSLRVGLAFAKGIALARHIPLIGVPTLDVLASAQPIQEIPLVAVLQAGRGRLAVGWYQAKGRSWQPASEVEVLTAENLAERIQETTFVSGELSAEDRRTLRRNSKGVRLASPAQAVRRPSYLAELAWKHWQAGQVDDPVTLSPIYVQTRKVSQP